MMFSCYRRDEAHDPEMYCAAVAAVLADYPREVVDHVTDPRTGLPGTQKFLPNVAEVREACDARAASTERARTYDERVAEQTRLTREWLAQKPSDNLKAAGRAWLDRSDPIAQEVSGQKPRTAEEKATLLERAEATGAEISSGAVQLSDEAKALLWKEPAG